MATAGLSFANPFFDKVNVGEEPNPYAPYSPTSGIGLGGLAPSAADMAVMGEALVPQSQFTMPEMRKPPSIAFSPSRNEFFVQGNVFRADDAPRALQAEQLLGGPGTGLPTEGDWVPLDQQAYSQYLQSIRQPSLGRLASKSFGRGVDVMQALGGRALQLAGAEELGGRIVAAQEEQLARTSPYERQFTDIESGRGAVEWFVANFAQQGPNMIESVLTAGLGFLAGTAAGGPLAGVGGAMAGLMGKTAFKESVKAAARKQAAGEVLSAAENKLLREAAGIAGAVATSYAQNLATGAADIYGELRDQGANADDIDARLKALAGSVPYAALETLPEYLLASRLFGGAMGAAPLPAGAGRVRRGAELLRRGAVGGAVGGAAEGTTEAGQEALLLGISGQDLSSPEAVNRLINSFAAGFGVGGPIGAVANLRSKKPENLLNPGGTSEPTTGSELIVPPGTQPPGPGTAVSPYYTPVTPVTPAGTIPTPPAQLAGPTVPQLPGPVQPVSPMGGPVMMVTPEGVAYPEQMMRQQGNIPPGATPGSQGVLDIFGGAIPAQELASRMQPQAQPALTFTPGAPTPLPGQGALQFAPPAPEAPAGTMANPLQVIQDRLRRQREFELAEQQRQQQIEAERQRIAQESRGARDFFAMQQAENVAAAQMGGLPMRQAGPTQPVQLPLFTRRQAPVPSRAEGLRRGVGTQIPQAAPASVPLTAAQRRAQIPLITQEGQPSVAALKAAGVRTKLPPAPPKAPVVRQRTQRGLKKQAGVAAVEVKETPSATQERKLKQGRVEQRQQDNAGVRKGREAGQQPTPQVPAGGAQAGGRRLALQRRKKQEVTPEAPKPPKAEAVAAAAPVEQAAEVTPAKPKEVYPELDDNKLLAGAIGMAGKPSDVAGFTRAMQTVFEYAFFIGEDTNVRKLVDQARAFLANTPFTDEQMSAMDQAFLDSASFQTQLEATYKGGAKKGQQKPWFTYAVARNLLPNIKATITNLPAAYKQQTDPVTDEKVETKPVESSAEKMAQAPEALLGELIGDLISRIREYSKLDQPVNFNGIPYDNVVELAKQLYARTSAVGKNYVVRGYKLKEYFKADGSPKMLKSGGRYIITTKELTTAEQRKLEKEQREEAQALADEEAALRMAEYERARLEKEGFQDEDAWDNDDGMFYRDDGTALGATIPAGRVRLLVRNFLSKLRIKPNTFIYSNVADLKARNPDLYRRAAAARKQGDFDTTNAVGYSFGPNVIIFTDFVRTEQQLKFVLAHETLGHFGFKGVVPKAQLDKVLNRIYDIDPDVQAAVDAMVVNRGMSKLEAIEEYLADNAADLDTSIVARIWNVLKNFLNKLGFEFQDDEARYFVNLARKYVRQGDAGNFVNAKNIVLNLQAIEQDKADGRYARVSAGEMGSRVFAAGSLNRRYGATGGLLGSVEAFAKGLFGSRRDVPGTVGRILEQVQTLDNKARRSYGLNQIYRILEKQQQYARSLLSKYQRMTQFTHSPAFGFGIGKGVTEEQKQVAGELLARAALLRAEQTTDELIKSYDSLVNIDEMGNVTVDPAVRSAIEKAGFVTAEEFRKGFDIKYSDGSTARFQFDVDENSPEWKVYTEMRDTVNEAAIDLMLSNYEASQAEAKRVVGDLNAKRRGTNVFTNEDLAAIRRAAKLYQDKRYEGSDIANNKVETKVKSEELSEDFVIAFGRALFDDRVFAIWVKDPNVDTNTDMFRDLEEFQAAEYDDIRAALPSLREKFKGSEDARKDQSYKVQKAIRDLFFFDLQSKNADYYAKHTILGSYVPYTRRGTEQVRLVAVDERGNLVALDENIRAALPYFQFNTRREAMDVAAELDKEFGGDNEFKLLDENGNEVTVRFKTEVSRTRQSPDLTEAVNFNEFVYVLNRLNINLAPEARERIVTTLTSQNARARRNLQRSGTEGWDKDVVRSVSEHLETSAHVAAKKLYRHRLDDILMNNSNWLGDDQLLNSLKAAVDNAQTDGERARAQRAYDEYAYMYRYMKGSAGENTVTIDGKEVPTLGRGEDYREEAKKVLRWYSETTNITDSTEDLLSGEAGSALKLATVLMQLGGSVATAVVNLASLATHSLPYLSYYNSKRGFGGGYGFAKANTALWKAASDVKNANLSDDAFLEQMMRDSTYDRFNLTEDEAQFLLEQTEQGTLQAAQFNALVGTARGKVLNNKAQAAVKTWMSLFSYTEQFNRRVTALAAYRLEKERLQSQGVTDQNELIEAATEAARTAVNSSQGEYAMFNRPEMARGNVLQYIFMYKQFVIVTVQLMRSLPVKGQLLMLGFLLLTSGLKGLPFAEDIFDIVNTIAQKLGLKMGSVEKEIAEWVDAIFPGATPYVMRGVLDRWTGATVSTRLGMGDLVPLTGAFKAGADPAREVSDFAGPVFSGISGLVGMAGSFAKYGAETIGLKDDVTSISGILRDSPIAAVRAMADGLSYLDSGMITNNRGQVVSREAPYHVILARMLGFYPAIASEQNDIVRLSKDVANYAKAIKADYVSAYVKAKLANDTDRMQQITADVRQWNEDAKGTGLEISTFTRSANRAALEASRPTVLRYLKSAPKNVREETLNMLEINGLIGDVR